jgi:hypothetical protein
MEGVGSVVDKLVYLIRFLALVEAENLKAPALELVINYLTGPSFSLKWGHENRIS